VHAHYCEVTGSISSHLRNESRVEIEIYSGSAVTLRECSLKKRNFLTLVLNIKFMKMRLSVPNLLKWGRTGGRTKGQAEGQFFLV
jgi:hypothetical protein